MPNTTINSENQNVVTNVVANAAPVADAAPTNVSFLQSLMAEAEQNSAKDTPQAIAKQLVADGKALAYNNVTIRRIGTNGLYDGEDEERILRSPERMFYTIHIDTGIYAAINGNIVKNSSYFYCSYYELLGVLKASPMAAFADVVAANPTAATILLPGSVINICDEAVAAGEYVNPFGSGTTSNVASNTFIQHIISMTASPTASKIIEKQAEKFVNF